MGLREDAHRWGLDPGELAEFRRMIVSGPWKIISIILNELQKGSEEELLNRTDIIDIARAQGKAQAVNVIKSKIRALMPEEEKDE